jgi:hypothetical protein
MNSIHDKTCVFCNSSMFKRAGKPHCSGDNLHVTKLIFDRVLAVEFTEPEEFAKKVYAIQFNESSFDLFISYWSKKKKDPTTNLHCIHEDTYFRDIHEEVGKLPIPEPYIPFPDLVEVYIAEIMLGRELTPLEKDGSRWIPKIRQEDGSDYFAALTWIRFPHSYISLKDMTIKTDYDEPLMAKIFDIEVIRDRYASRDGSLIDE